MHFETFELTNYKSYQKASLSFAPGFNLIIGRNNAGKSALLEALAHGPPNNPHRSLATAPTADHPLDPSSSAEFVFRLSPAEVERAVTTHVGRVTVPIPNAAPNQGQSGPELLASLRKNGARVSVRMLNGAPHVALPLHGVQPNHSATLVAPNGSRPGPDARIEELLYAQFARSIFMFRAERFHIGVHPFGDGQVLQADAANLPQVLNTLRSISEVRFAKFDGLVRRVLPHIKRVAVWPTANGTVEVKIWEVDPSTDRSDLTVPLAACGTGTAQVLSMLYVLASAETPRVLIIDEPNSFLHPGAVRALMEIFSEEKQHQYIISTHTPQVVVDADSPTIFLLTKTDSTQVARIPHGDAEQTRRVLDEVGAKLSDVFGADAVLWVEGPTEERCFRLIARHAKLPLGRSAIVGVLHTGDFGRRTARWAVEVYSRLSKGSHLIPPALGFIFDREDRSDAEREGLERQSDRKVSFLPRRMYENYLLDAEALAALLASLGEPSTPETQSKVAAVLESCLQSVDYLPKNSKHPTVDVDGAKVLKNVVSTCTEARHEYAKVAHGAFLTDWLLEHRPEALGELVEILRAKLPRRT